MVMNCKMSGCSGKVNVDQVVASLRVGCSSFSPVHACDTCGRLYWSLGGLVFNRQGDAAFVEKGSIVNKKESKA